MSNSRQEKNSRHENSRQENRFSQAEEVIRDMGERTVEQTAQAGHSAVQAGEEVARAGADMLQQNIETLQNPWRSGLEVATKLMGRSTDQLGRTLGLSNEAQQATERLARNAETIIQSTAVISKVMSGMSKEYFELVQHQFQSSMDRMSELSRCRTPQELAAVQTDLVREAVGSVLESTRRIADMSTKLSEDTAKRMTQNMEQMAGNGGAR